ncbi:hypothetical protein AURDEDRAFT_115814 [Auricularia subglabra TFB-10046 SS5]|nr:hypothetical protein AURDEDRAFT_115814 [Auricularia subglabra TFB-10046 SS5]
MPFVRVPGVCLGFALPAELPCQAAGGVWMVCARRGRPRLFDISFSGCPHCVDSSPPRPMQGSRTPSRPTRTPRSCRLRGPTPPGPAARDASVVARHSQDRDAPERMLRAGAVSSRHWLTGLPPRVWTAGPVGCF